MARRLGDTPFLDLLPQNLVSDATVIAAATALDGALRKSVLSIPALLLFARLAQSDTSGFLGPLARLTELAGGLPDLPEDVLDLMAWQLHVDGYEAAQTYEGKRRMVNRSILLHRRKGTPWAVAEALRSVGYADARIIEGSGDCRYNGEISYDGRDSYAAGNRWALFDVEVDLGEGEGISGAAVARLRSAVEVWKNARSHLRAISWAATVTDVVALSEAVGALRVQPCLQDVREWGFPLYNGAIRYNNGCLCQHNGGLLYDGAAMYQPYKTCGHTYNAVLDALSTGMTATYDDAVHFTPRHDAALTHNGAQRHGPSIDAFASQQALALHAACSDAVPVTEATAIQIVSENMDKVGLYHDGSLSYGQQRIWTYNCGFLYDGSAFSGPYEGRDFYPVRHDGRTSHNKSAVHSLWGWQPGSAHAPFHTYSALADACSLRAGQMEIQDALDLTDTCDLTLRRFSLYTGSHRYSGTIYHDVQEEAYAI